MIRPLVLTVMLLTAAFAKPMNGAVLFCEGEGAKFVSIHSRLRVFMGKNCNKAQVKAGGMSNHALLWEEQGEDHKSLKDLTQFMYSCKNGASVTLRSAYKAKNGKIRWRKFHSVSNTGNPTTPFHH